jgi:GGDEF domain-containing protein
MSDLPRDPDVFALASDVGLAIAVSPDLHEMLSVIARRVAEALDVWECDIYEYLPESDALAAAALWSPDMTEQDRKWLGTVYPVAERPSYARLLSERGIREHHADDPDLPPEDAEIMQARGQRSVLTTPLIFQDAVVGALTVVEKRAPRRFSPGDLRLLELMAVPAAVSVHNARMFRREAEQNRRLQALLGASRAMSSTIRLDELLDAIAAAAGRALDTAECAINTYDPEAEALVVRAYYQRDAVEDPSEWLGRSYALADYPADRATLNAGKTTEERVSDPDLDEANRRSMLDNDEKTHLSVPLEYEGRPIGLLVFIEIDRERQFTDEERQVAWALGEQATVAISNAQLLVRSEEQNRQLHLLLESTRAISSSVVLEDVLATVARTTAEALGAEQCQIQEYDSAANTVTPVAFWQHRTDVPEPDSMHKTYSLDDEPDERAFLERKQVVQQLYSAPDVTQVTRGIMDKYGDLSYLNVPLIFNEQSFGVMVLVETEYERRWTAEEVDLARALGDQAAVAIEHARLYRRVQDQAVTDGLTGLYNHRHFYERLDQEIARARRYGTPVSLLMIDIDDFKAFNDRHGHLAGDIVLREMADALRAELRQNLDIAARYWGEEFSVILPNTPMVASTEAQMEMDLAGKLAKGRDGEEPPAPGHRDGAGQVAERIRRRVAEAEFVAADGKPLSRLTVSIGVAVFPHGTDMPEDLVGNADAALYKAKRAGKDRVESYG